jgi:DnaJ-class molecular chaperone
MDSPKRSRHSSYQFDKESNKDASYQYLERAKQKWQCGDIEAAQRFAEKAMKLYPSEDAKELIIKISKSQETGPAKEKMSAKTDSSTKTNQGSPKFESSHSFGADRVSNKEASFQYLERAKKCWQCGDNEEAQRLAEKAMELYPSDEAKELISKISQSQETENKNQKSIERILKTNDYYEILDISKEASETDIKKSYRKLSKQVHPDKNKAPEATKVFQKLQNAYEVLCDKEKRRTYDATKKYDQAKKNTSAKPDSSTNTNPGSYKFDPSHSNTFDKESNKEASFQHLERAKKFWQSGDYEEALKYAKKAMKLYPSNKAKELISKIAKSQEDEKEVLKTIELILRTEDYYEILGISKWASEMDILFSYNCLVQQLNLEWNIPPSATAKALEKIQNAFTVLSDKELRQKYDQAREYDQSNSAEREESNKDASSQYLERALKCLLDGDNEEAQRLAKKAMELYPSEKAKELLIKIAKSVEDRYEFSKTIQLILETEDYYEILGISNLASEMDILFSYNHFVQQLYLLDIHNITPAAMALEKVKNAFSVLSDKDKRQQYDQANYGFPRRATSREFEDSANPQKETVNQGHASSRTRTTQSDLRYNPYLSTLPKSAAVVSNALFYICVLCGEEDLRNPTNREWCIFLSVSGFCITAVLLAFYLMHLCEKFHIWLQIKSIFMIIWAIFYIFTSMILAINKNSPAFMAASFFGYVTFVLYSFSFAYLQIKSIRVRQLAQADLLN